MNLHDLFRYRCATPSDINEHLPLLYRLAGECSHVTEFGVRSGNSTVAFLAALEVKQGHLVSYDISPTGGTFAGWEFRLADTSTLADIEPTDLLFIDTLHNYAQLTAELKHANRARRFLAFHDTVTFGFLDETGYGRGLMPAINEFLAANPHWQCYEDHRNNNGLLVLART
jgi:hypothetical protein